MITDPMFIGLAAVVAAGIYILHRLFGPATTRPARFNDTLDSGFGVGGFGLDGTDGGTSCSDGGGGACDAGGGD